MSRRDGFSQEREELPHLIDSYKSLKDEENRIKKVASSENERIKQIMAKLGVNTFDSESGKWTATTTKIQNESIDDDRLIEVLRNNLDKESFSKVVKTKEYVDDDALEKLIYDGKVDITLLESCKIVGEPTTRLTISKVSKKKEN